MATYLDGVETSEDPNVVAENIKYGVTIMGVAGHINVRDSSDADAEAGDVTTDKTFYAGGGGIKTGTL